MSREVRTPAGPVEPALRQRSLRLLLLCSRTCASPEQAGQITALVQEGLDWDSLLELAFTNGVAQLVYRQLQAICPDGVPGAVLETLKAHFLENTARNLLLTGELLEILERLQAEGIPAVPIKGPVLAAAAYGDLSLRRFEDLDLLVRRQDFLRARDVIIAQGYAPDIRFSRAPDPEYFRESVLTCAERRVVVELTWGFTSGFYAFRANLAGVWRRLRRQSLAGRRVPDLAPEDLLLVLCTHGTKHLWARLGWVCDVAEVIRASKDLDWPFTLRLARQLGAERMLFLGVFLARRLLGAEIPNAVAEAVEADTAMKFLAGQVYPYLFEGAPNPFDGLAGCLFHLRARERAQDRIRYCLDLLTTPTAGDWNSIHLPACLSFLHGPLRPLRLLGRFALSPVRHLFGSRPL